MPVFAERIKTLRQSQNLTQTQVATLAGVTERTYQNYEYGKREPSIDALNKLADYFKVSVDYLIGRDNSYNE